MYDPDPYARLNVEPVTASWQEAVLLIARQRKVVVSTFVVGTLLFLALAFLKAPAYTALARIALRQNVAFTPVSDDAETPIVAHDTEYRQLEPAINAHVAILQSGVVIRTALEALEAREVGDDDTVTTGAIAEVLKLVRRTQSWPGRLYRSYHSVPDKTDLDAEVERVQVSLVVEPIEKSNLIEVAYTDEDPRRAATVVNAIVRAFLNPRAPIPENADAVRFFEEQGRLLGEKARAAKQELRAFLRTEAADLPFEQESDLRHVWLDTRTHRDQSEAELAEISARHDSLVTEIARFPSHFSMAGQVEQSEVVLTLKTRLADLDLERSAMLAQYTPSSTIIRDLDRQILRAKEMLAAERKQTSTALGESGPTMQKLILDLVTTRTSKDQLAGRLDALDAEIETYAGRLDRLDRLSSEHKRLRARAGAAEDAYLTYLKKEEEARFSKALQAASIMDVEVIERAATPTRPDPTGKTLVFLLGTILSMGLGLMMAVVRDRLDPSLKTITEVQEISGLPVVGSLWLEAEVAEPMAIGWDAPGTANAWTGRP